MAFDLNEAELVGSTDMVTVVAQMDRYAGGYDGDGDTTSTKRYKLMKDSDLYTVTSPELADLTIYVIDVAAGDKIPSKGGPGITRSDLLVINKIDLAPYVGVDLPRMAREARAVRRGRPVLLTNCRTGAGLAEAA